MAGRYHIEPNESSTRNPWDSNEWYLKLLEATPDEEGNVEIGRAKVILLRKQKLKKDYQETSLQKDYRVSK